MAVFRPTFNGADLAREVGELLGINPGVIVDVTSIRSSEDPGHARIEAKVSLRITEQEASEILTRCANA
jgi:hypothetical protein